jgi:hypothetical protein
MSNSTLEASHRDTLANTTRMQTGAGQGTATRPARSTRLRFLTESARYLGLDPDRDVLVRRLLWQTDQSGFSARA